MSTHKYIDRICVIAVVISLLLSLLLVNAEAFGITQTVKVMGYENRLFDTSRVHTIDIVMDDWDGFLTTAQSEEYSECAVVIDGESYKNVAIRGKGNTSLSTVSSMDSDRYSFKLEFDHYDSNKNYHGLDKLSLNNVIQDNTYMKDYLTYRLMNENGVSAPLCSYVYITVNGEDWGLYLAVEGVEDSFLQRNYGNNYGELYKPDSMSFGGGRGNGRDFDFSDFMSESEESGDTENSSSRRGGERMQGGFDPSAMQNGEFEIPEDFDFSQFFEGKGNGGFGGFGGMGSSDVKLQYVDDNADSYSNIFDNAKTDITDADKERLIASLKQLSENTDIESVVDTEKVIRYFVVHNFVCNGDSYTGSMIHNYYLYEENGQLSMIPWDYNLAYGTFQSGNAQSEVNSPIDSPVSGDVSDRPMISWIFESEEYTELYHQYFSEFLKNVDITAIIDEAVELIAPYVEKDPTKFCTYEEFEVGVNTLRTFCELRAESVQGQLEGTIPSTSEGQSADSSALIDASAINLSDMGTMNMGGGMNRGGFGGENRQDRTRNDFAENQQTDIMQTSAQFISAENSGMPQMNAVPQGGMELPDGFGGGMQGIPASAMGEIPKSGNTQTDENHNPAMQMPQAEKDSADTEAETTDDENGGSNTRNPFGGNGEMPDFTNMEMPDFGNAGMPQEGNSDSGTSSYILLCICAVLLCGGLLFAFKFKR